MRRTMWRVPVVLVAASCMLVPAFPGVHAQTTGYKIRVEPTDDEPSQPLDDRRYAKTIMYYNDGLNGVRLRLALELLRHDLDGTIVTTPSEEITRAFTLDKSTIDLAPGTSASVEVRGSIPASARAAYPVVVASYGDSEGSNIGTNIELNTFFLLRGPEPWDERVAVTDVGILRKEGDKVTFFADLRNTGNVHVRPRGVIEIRYRGRLIDTVRLDPDRERPGAILPTCPDGCVRRLTGVGTMPDEADEPDGPDGPGGPGERDEPVDLTVIVREPAARSKASMPLPGGQAPSEPSASIGFTRVSAAGIDAEVSNTGAITLSELSVHMEILEDERTRAAQRAFPLKDLAPTATQSVPWDPAVADGRYTVVARALSGTTELARTEATLQIGQVEDVSRSAPTYIALLLLVVAGLFLVWFLWRRRKDREGQPTP